MTDSNRIFKFSKLPAISQWVLRISGVLLLAILFLVSYYYFTYIDENITQGSGYGFSIGEDKGTVFKNVSKNYSKEILGIAVLSDGDFVLPDDTSTLYRKITFTEQEFQEISQFDHWRLFFDEYYTGDYLEFRFQEDRLVTIHRHKFVP